MSLRVRLLAVLAAVAIGALVAADFATYSVLRNFLLGQVDQSLQATHQPIEQSLLGGQGGSPDGGDGGGPGPGSGPPPQFARLAPQTFIEVRTASGQDVVEQPSYERGSGRQDAPSLPARIGGFSMSSDPNEPTTYFDAPAADTGGPQFRVRASKLANGDQLILAVPMTSMLDTLHHLLYTEIAVTLAAVIAIVAAGWWMVRLGLRPLRQIEHTAAAIAAGELDQRIPDDQGRSEVSRLARALNVMLERIQVAFAARDATEAELRRSEGRLRRFVSDASHELRTPLAAVSAYSELFQRGAASRPDDLDRVMAGISSETARMGHLVEDLLLLARMDEGLRMESLPVDLVAVAGAAADASRAVGPAWPVHVEASRPVEVSGDELRLRQVVDNLLANVRAHTPPGTRTAVSVAAEEGAAVLRVTDDGPGLSPEEAPRLFERFYRSDPSRSRQSGGAGLGLSIVAAIVEAHGGTVGASPAPGGGAVFTVTLPLAP